MSRFAIFWLLIIVCARDVLCEKSRQENSSLESDENASGERTLMISKFVLLPIMAGVGVKFLILLPIILSKIALLGILSFVSSNLSLLASAIMGVRSYFFEDNQAEENYDYDGNYKSRYESYDPYKYSNHKDPHDDHHQHEDIYDHYDKYMQRYKSYENSHPGYNSHYPQYKHHDDHIHSKKRFRPFKLLERIKDAIKDHFHQSRGHGKRNHDYDHGYNQHHHEHHHSSDLSNDHNEYSHEMHDTRYKNPDHGTTSHNMDLQGKYYHGYKVPQDWSHKDEVTSNHTPKHEEHQDPPISESNGLLDDNLKILFKDDDGDLSTSPNFTELQTTAYKVYENDPSFKKSFIVLGVHPEARKSDSPDAFYATNYKISDFQTIPQADTSK